MTALLSSPPADGNLEGTGETRWEDEAENWSPAPLSFWNMSPAAGQFPGQEWFGLSVCPVRQPDVRRRPCTSLPP